MIVDVFIFVVLMLAVLYLVDKTKPPTNPPYE